MPRALFIFFLALVLALPACGNDGDPEPGSEQAAADSTGGTAGTAPRGGRPTEPASTECGKGGTQCPAGQECVNWRNGRQACGPLPVEAAVLISDTTLDGRCTFEDPADTVPGASIASVQLLGTDGTVKGYGRLLWDAPGFEVAAERGTPPDGTNATGNSCSDAYNIGCDGQAVFEIIGEDGEVRKLRDGEMVVVNLRGQEVCNEAVFDEVQAAICSDPGAAASGQLASCKSKVRMVELRSDEHGPDRVGGTIQFISRNEPQ